jgi:hypothetical protein
MKRPFNLCVLLFILAILVSLFLFLNRRTVHVIVVK